MTTYWCELALVDDHLAQRVSIDVADGRFGSIAANVDPPADARQLAGLTLPGFANAHSHAFHRALRGRTQGATGSFWTWRELMYRAAAGLTPENYHRLARATFAEMAMAGISAVGEFHYVHHQPDGSPYPNANAMGEALLAAATDAGIRITLLDTLYLHGGLSADGYAEPTSGQLRFCDRSAEAWIERVDQLMPSDTQKVGAAIHSVRAVDPKSMAAVAAWAERHDAPLHAHVSEQVEENEQCVAGHGVTPTALLVEVGAADERFSAVHGTHLTPDDVAHYASTNSTVCFCPTTERDLGDGIGPSTELVDAGVPLSLGSDSHAVIDMFEEARAVELDERLRSRRRGVHSAASLMTMATVNGHRCLGWTDAGSIVTGNRADLVTVSLDSTRTTGGTADDAVETAIFAATAGDVTDVLIDGTPIVTDRLHSTIDVPAELLGAITELLDT